MGCCDPGRGVALLLAALIGRWKVVPDAEYRSGTEF